MLINLRNALMCGKRLPYDAEVEYIESTGTQYVDLGLNSTTDKFYNFEISFALTTATSSIPFGYAYGGTARYGLWNNTTNWLVGANNGNSIDLGAKDTDLHHVLTNFGTSVEVDGSTLAIGGGSVRNNIGLNLFARVNSASDATSRILSNAKIFMFRIWDTGGNLLRDYIPVRKGTVGYFYDRVSGKLFGNAGTGDFVLGPDVVPVEYIESHGTEYIAMGIAGNALSRIDIGIEKTETIGTRRFVVGSNRDPNASVGSSTYFDVNTSGYFGQNSNGFACTVGQWYNLSIRADGYYSDGIKVYSPFIVFPLSTSVDLCLLSIGTATGNRWVGCISYLKAWDTNGVPVRSFLPVRVGTEGAMMDVLTRRIYRNQGTGAFTYGNDLPYPIPAA